MKTVFLSAMIATCCGLSTNNGFAQTEQPQIQKNEEIIIRKNGEAPNKMLIEIDSNNITINGKPMSDYNGNVTIMKRNEMNHNGDDLLSLPQRDENRIIHLFVNSDKAFLGVLTAKTDKGAIIKNVVDGSAAKKAGLMEGDIITKAGDKVITSPEDLRNAIQDMKAGDNITITYLRDGKKNTKKVELGKTENNSITMSPDNMPGMTPFNNYNFSMPQMPRSFNFNYFNNRPKMGLKIEDTEDGNGAKVLDVEPGSAAAKAGIKKDDIITEINGEKVNGVNDVMSQINQSPDKNDYKIKAKRDNKEKSFDVVIPKVLKKINV